MKNSNESSNNLKVVVAGLQPAETLEQGIIVDSSKAGKKLLPEQGRTMLEGEVVIPLGLYKADKVDDKHINVQFLGKVESKKVEEEQTI